MKLVFVIIILIACCFFNSCKNEIGESETFLLSNNYKGAVYVIYNQKKGQAGKYEKGSRLFEIPENGILRTQLQPNNGWHLALKCFYNLNGQRVEVPFKLFSKNIIVDSVQSCCLTSGSAYKMVNKNPTPYDMFYIGTGKLIDSLISVGYKFDIRQYLDE